MYAGTFFAMTTYFVSGLVRSVTYASWSPPRYWTRTSAIALGARAAFALSLVVIAEASLPFVAIWVGSAITVTAGWLEASTSPYRSVIVPRFGTIVRETLMSAAAFAALAALSSPWTTMARAARSVAIRPRAMRAKRNRPFGEPTGSRRSGGRRGLFFGEPLRGEATDRAVDVVEREVDGVADVERDACVRAEAGAFDAGRRADVEAEPWRSVTGSSPAASSHQAERGPAWGWRQRRPRPSARATCT